MICQDLKLAEVRYECHLAVREESCASAITISGRTPCIPHSGGGWMRLIIPELMKTQYLLPRLQGWLE